MRLLSAASLLLVSFFCANARAEETPKSLEYEVTIVHLATSETAPADLRSLSGAAMMQALPAWRAAGKVERQTSVRMSALENQPASVQIGETVPFVSGRTINASGGRGTFGQANFQMEQLGTVIACTGRIADSGVVIVNVAAEQTRIGRAGNAPKPEKPAEGAANADFPPPGRVSSMAKTTVSTKSGECQLIGSAWNDGPDGTTATLVLLVPRILAPAK